MFKEYALIIWDIYHVDTYLAILALHGNPSFPLFLTTHFTTPKSTSAEAINMKPSTLVRWLILLI